MVIIIKVSLQILFYSHIEVNGTADNKFVRQEVSTRLFFSELIYIIRI